MGMHVVIINGTGGVGKDTLISEFRDIVNAGVVSISIVDNVKRAAMVLGWDCDSKTDEDRKALSELKDFSNKYWTTPVNYVMTRYQHWRDNERRYSDWFFITARTPDDIAELVELIPDVKTVLITRDGIESHGNHADDEVNNYEYDLVFKNNKNITRSGMDFAEVIYKLFDENPNNLCTSREVIHTNISGKRFFDYGEYGLSDFFTVSRCFTHYQYNMNGETPDGSHWFKRHTIEIHTASGVIYTIPFCPWKSCLDKDNKSFSDYYNEQPW